MKPLSNTAQTFSIFSGRKLWLHIIFWVGHTLIRIYLSRYHTSDFLQNAIIELTELPVKVIMSYLSVYLIESYIKEWRIRPFIIGFVISFALAWILKRLHDWYLVFPVYLEMEPELRVYFWNFIGGIKRMIYIYPTVVGLLAMTYTIEWFEKERANRELKTKQLENELKYLKSKVQPHFLFNTLNNLYGLSLSQSEKTPELILQLSEFLSFMIYQSEKKRIHITEEIDLIENLYSLESLRTGADINFTFTKPSEISGVSVPPLLLFPLAENAFKFGIGDEDGTSRIQLELEVNETHITFTTRNRIRKDIKSDDNEKSGLGLATLKQRLDLLYPDNYELEHYEREDEYFSRLLLPVS